MSESRTITNHLIWGNVHDNEPLEASTNYEAGLVTRFQAGDLEIFDEFYTRLLPLVHGIAVTRVPFHDVDDIV
ncbi:MAG: hypothetical protein ACK5NT_13655, partial [Pyrinomonadaceae bacterium]